MSFQQDRRKAGGFDIYMYYAPGRFVNLVQKDVVQVMNYNQSGQSFRVFYNEQAPNLSFRKLGLCLTKVPDHP